MQASIQYDTTLITIYQPKQVFNILNRLPNKHFSLQNQHSKERKHTMILRLLMISFIAYFLSACNIFQIEQENINTIKQWDTKGRVSIKTPNVAVYGNFDWHESPINFSLRIYGPLGQGSTKLSGINNKKVTLTYSNKKIVGRNATSLLRKKLGWEFPVNQVKYWIRGLPYPKTPYRLTNNNKTRLPAIIRQDSWKVSYKTFSDVKGLYLPKTIQVSHPPYQVNLIITNWNIQ